MALETIQWLWSLAKAYDMVEYAKMRYNLLGNGGSWFPGYKADKLVDGEVSEGELLAALKDYPHADRVAPILEEAKLRCVSLKDWESSCEATCN